MQQLTIDTKPLKMKPSARAVLNVLKDLKPHSALEFKRGEHNFYCDAVAQRVSELNQLGYVVANVTKDGGVATYQLVGVHEWAVE